MKKFYIITIICFISIGTNAKNITGTIIDKSTQKPLKYANIGILGKAVGTVSSSNGTFHIKSALISHNDSLRISMIGYKSQIFCISEINPDQLFELEKDIINLNEIVIQSHTLKERRLGTKTASKKIVSGWGSGDGSGGEIGIKISSKSYPVFLDQLNFFIAVNKYDSVLLRLHIRSIKDGFPDKELLYENILIPVKTESGWVNVDLRKYQLWLEEDFVLSLEWLEAWGSCQEEFCLNYSMNLFKGTIYYKFYSEDIWQIKKNKSPSFYLNTRY